MWLIWVAHTHQRQMMIPGRSSECDKFTKDSSAQSGRWELHTSVPENDLGVNGSADVCKMATMWPIWGRSVKIRADWGYLHLHLYHIACRSPLV